MSDPASGPPCASWARDLGVEPAGTAPQFDVLVLVEHPLPWPRDIPSDPLLASLARTAAQQLDDGRTMRLQASAIGPDQPERRVVVFDRGEGPFAGYGRSEGSAPVDGLGELVADLIRRPRSLPSTVDVTDVLICTHGTRDRCCGSLGTRLWMATRQGLDSVRVWRTSHTGGHRFAPTAITFPDGACWAHLDEKLLRALVDRSLPVSTATAHLRGCVAFGPTLQAADGAVLVGRGWEWLSYARHGEDCGSNRVGLHFEAPSGERGTYDVELEPGRELPVPPCRTGSAATVKSQVELKVVRMQLASSA